MSRRRAAPTTTPVSRLVRRAAFARRASPQNSAAPAARALLSSARMRPLLLAALLGAVVACGGGGSSPDAGPASECCSGRCADPCSLCSASEICVQRFDGVCGTAGAECVPRTTDCPANACSAGCEAAYCPAPYQCQNRPPCGSEVATAFTCYGP